MNLTETGQLRLADDIRALSISRDGSLVVAAAENQVTFWWPQSDKPNRTVPYTGSLSDVAISPSGDVVAISMVHRDSFVELLRVSELCHSQQKTLPTRGPRKGLDVGPASLWSIRRFPDVVTTLAFSPDGRQLALASHDVEVAVCDSELAQEQHTWESGTPVTGMVFSDDGKWLTYGTGRRDGRVIVRALKSGKQKLNARTGSRAGVRCVAFSPNSNAVVAGCSDCSVKQWPLTRKTPAFSIQLNSGIRQVVFANSRLVLAGLGDGSIAALDLQTGKHVATFSVDVDPIVRIAMAGQTLVTACGSGKVQLWEIDGLEDDDEAGALR